MTIETGPTEKRNERIRKAPYARCASHLCLVAPLPNLPLCEDHAWDVWADMNAHRGYLEESAAAENRRRDWIDERIAKDRAKLEAIDAGTYRTDPGIIYYVQVADTIKIGFTRDLNMRLQAYPPMARLLATHPGTFQLEAEMHRKFSRHLAGRKEWFMANEELTAHLEQVRSTFKQDARVTA